MRKLSLNLQELEVETFQTEKIEETRGTVEGRGPTLLASACTQCNTNCLGTDTCNGCFTTPQVTCTC